MQTSWQDRQHAAHVRTRYFSGGWEFNSAQEAIDYVSTQYSRQPAADLRHTPFRFTVQSNGVQFEGYCGPHVEMDIRSTTYRKGATMRDTVAVSSPSDCIWIIPGTVNS